MLYQTTGYLPLVAKHQFKTHPRKQKIVKNVLPGAVLEALLDRTKHATTQGPDLLMYERDFSDWFFFEVKGPEDRRRPTQDSKFEDLAMASRNPMGGCPRAQMRNGSGSNHNHIHREEP